MSPFAPSPASCFGDLRTSVKEGESRGEREARTLHYALRTRFPNNFLLKVTRRKERFLSENFSFSFFPLNVSSSFFSPSPPRFHFGLEKWRHLDKNEDTLFWRNIVKSLAIFFPIFFPEYRILRAYSRFSKNVPSCVKSTVERVFELRIKWSLKWRIVKRQGNRVNKISGKENCHRFRTSWHLVTVSRTAGPLPSLSLSLPPPSSLLPLSPTLSRGGAIFCMTELPWSKREVCINAVQTELDVRIRYFSLHDWYKKDICRMMYSTFSSGNFEYSETSRVKTTFQSFITCKNIST